MDSIVILNQVLTLILMLYGDSSLPRNIVQKVISFLEKFTQSILSTLKNDILIALKYENLSKDAKEKLDKIFRGYDVIFEQVSTEKKIFSFLKKKGMIKYEEYEIGSSFVNAIVDNKMHLVYEILYGIYVPLGKTLKLFLELPGMFQNIMQYVEQLNKKSDIIANIMQADL